MRGVAFLLAAVALLGFYLGVRGAMPTASNSEESAPAATTTGPVQDVQPIQEVIPPPPVPEPKAEDANVAASKAADEDEDEDEDAPAPPPPPVKAPRPPAANSAPADPIGNLIQQPPPEETPPEEVPF